MLHIYYAFIGDCALTFDASQLSSYRLKKLETLSAAQSIRQAVAAELLLNHALRGLRPELELPLDISVNQFGKPYCGGAGLFFSISHCEQYVACAVSDHDLGIDIQVSGRYNERFVKRFFTAVENDYISKSLDKDRAFTKLWSLKESYLKAIGTGLRTSLGSFSIEETEEITVDTDICCGFWHRTIEDYHLSVCVMDSRHIVPDKIEEVQLP